MQRELIAGENVALFQDAESSAPEASIWASLRNWWLPIPLIYFATFGLILTNPQEMATGGYGGPSSATRGQQTAIWLLVLLIMGPYYRSIARAFKENKAVTALVAFTALSVIWSPDLLDSSRRVLLLTLTASFAYFLTERFSTRQLMQLVYFTGCLAVILSLIAIAFPAYGLMPTGEWKGIFGHKNDLGIFLCFLLSPVLFTPPRATLRNVAGYVCGVLGLVLIAGSQSRGAWIALGVLVIYASLLQVFRRMGSSKERVALTLAVLAILGVIGFVLYQNFADITYMLGKDPTLSNRGQIWSAVLGSISKRPLLGYGYGGFWNELHGESINIISTMGTNITHAHNGYLNLTLEIGLVGLGFFLFVLILAARDALKSIFGQRSIEGWWYGGIILLTVVASSEESFLMQYNAITTILFIVACVGLRKVAAGEEVG